jgi:Mn2+/Fe2+ NRAMP family transporter
VIDTQLLGDVLATVAFIVGLVIAIAIWVVAAAAVHERHVRRTHIGAIEQHLADVAGEQSPAASR